MLLLRQTLSLFPFNVEYLALEGLSDLMASVKMIRRTHNPELEMRAFCLPCVTEELTFLFRWQNEVKKYFKRAVFKTVITRKRQIERGAKSLKPALAYDRASKGSQAYVDLAREIIQNNSLKEGTIMAAKGLGSGLGALFGGELLSDTGIECTLLPISKVESSYVSPENALTRKSSGSCRVNFNSRSA
jgi:hypothetical protein